MLNIDRITSISYGENSEIIISMSNGESVSTYMPRQILVDMVNKISNKPELVTTHTEWAG